MEGQSDIQGLMQTALGNLKDMIDVNTVIGDMIQTSGGTSVIPVSRVACGFVAGGGEYTMKDPKDKKEQPFAGGSGAGVSVSPVGFLVVSGDKVRLVPVAASTTMERIIDSTPMLMEQLDKLLNKNNNDQEENSYSSASTI